MKKIILAFFAITTFITIIFLAVNVDNTVPQTKTKNIEKSKYKFESIGYYKGEDKTRCLTYNIKTNEIIDKNNIPESLIKQVTEHGLKEYNTNGKLTVAFYYIPPQSAPNISTMNHSKAMDVSHNHKPLIAVWQFGNGKHNVIFNP